MQRLQDAASVLSSSPPRQLQQKPHQNGHHATNGSSFSPSLKDGAAGGAQLDDGHHLDLVVEKWDSLWDMSLVYLQRLKSAEIVLAGLIT